MNLQLLENEAIVLLDQYGLADKGWTFQLGKRARALGVCKYRERLIEVSEHHAINDPAEVVLDTLKHEVAHAVAGPNVEAHGKEWKRIAEQIGCTQDACKAISSNPHHFAQKPGKFYANCPTCKREFNWYRKPKRMDGHYCIPCETAKVMLTIMERK